MTTTLSAPGEQWKVSKLFLKNRLKKIEFKINVYYEKLKPLVT